MHQREKLFFYPSKTQLSWNVLFICSVFLTIQHYLDSRFIFLYLFITSSVFFSLTKNNLNERMYKYDWPFTNHPRSVVDSFLTSKLRWKNSVEEKEWLKILWIFLLYSLTAIEKQFVTCVNSKFQKSMRSYLYLS